MKLKYYLRGLGVGILFSSIILSIAFHNKQQLSDGEIMERAEQMGMVMAAEDDLKLEDLLSSAPTSIPTTEPLNSKVDESSTPGQEPSTPTQEPITPVPSQEATNNVDAPIAEYNESSIEYITVHIDKGMSSRKVAMLLEDTGIVEDASSFNQYIIDNKLTKIINFGEFEIIQGASYEQILDIIMTNDY